MYKVSDECRAMLDSPGRITDFRCAVTLSNGNALDIGSSLIKNNSVYTKTRCVSGSDFELGAVCVGEFGFSLINDTLDGRNYEGAVVKPYYRVKLSDGTFEEIPMGEFNVTEISSPDSHTTKLVCYDNMVKFDKPFVSPDPSGGYFEMPLLEWVGQICYKCGVYMSQENRAAIASMPNGTVHMGFSSVAPFNSDIKTFRDILTMITQLLCGCAVMDRDGGLKIISFCRDYSDEYPSYVAIIGSDRRKSTNIKDRKRFDAVSISLTRGYGSSVDTFVYPGGNTSANVLYLDDNPILRTKTDLEVPAYLEAIGDKLSRLDYYGAETDIFGDPTIDVGDHILLTGGTAGLGTRILVTKNDWTYRGSHKLTSDASNIQAKATKATVTNSGTSSGGGTSGENVYTENIKQFEFALSPVFVSTEKKRICRITVTPDSFNVPVYISGQLVIDMRLSGTVTLSYSINGVERNIKTEQYLSKGRHTLELLLPFTTEEIKAYSVDVFVVCSHGHGESVSENCLSAEGVINVRTAAEDTVFESFGQCVTYVSLSGADYVKIPVLNSESTVSGTIDWGDGNTQEYSPASEYEHTYAESGDYTVAINCYIEKFSCEGNARTIILAESVKEIDSGAFAGCTELTSVKIPARVSKIGNYAFYNTALESVKISRNCNYEVTSFPNGCAIGFYPYFTEPATADAHGEFVQETSASVWKILHNLDKYPSVTVIDSDGELTLCEIEYTNENTVTLRFSEPTAGTVYIN